MKYWVYINDKVDGPYDGDSLVTLDGFTPDTLICSEADASSGKQSWAKASTIFDFEPTEEEQQKNAAATAAEAALGGLAANTLLEKLNALTQELSNLQNKLDTMESNMESHINKALEEQRTQLESAFAARTAASSAAPKEMPAAAEPTPVPTEEPAPQTEQPHEQPIAEEALGTDSDSESANKSSQEEELVIRSALDSLYNTQSSEEQEEKDENEDTFQDLLTPTQAKQLEKAAEQPAAEEPAPETNEQAKNDLLDELTGPAQDDVLDQIIKEKQEEEKGGVSPLAAAAIGAAAGAGIAALATSGDKEETPLVKETPLEQPTVEETPLVEEMPATNEEKIDLSDFESNMPEPLQIAPDKENPDQLEDVLPAEQMPADIPAQEQPAGGQDIPFAAGSLPGVEEVNLNEEEPQPVEEEVDDNENTLQELVPGAKMEPPDGVLVTEQDLREAFTERIPNMQEELVMPFSDSELSAVGEEENKPALDFSNQSVSEDGNNPQNANDLTEIELKEGATYLISDFVPPAQANQDRKGDEAPTATVEDKTAEIQDMLSSASAEEEKKKNADAMDIASALQQTTTKRGASFDIKTVPMVPEPGQAERLHVEGLDDGVNAQHDIKPADVKSSKPAKLVIGLLVGFLLLVILYALLAFMHLLPNSLNIFSKSAPVETSIAATQMEEILPTQQTAEDENAALQSVLEEVKNYTLPNGYTLQAFIEEKHPAVSPDLITWDISAAVEPDTYAVLTKVPPENPQSFKMSYRFNYNAVTKTLDPTISDAKNLLDSASSAPTLPTGL